MTHSDNNNITLTQLGDPSPPPHGDSNFLFNIKSRQEMKSRRPPFKMTLSSLGHLLTLCMQGETERRHGGD